MKNIILTLSTLFAVSIASAQTYPKQPDPTVVEYVPFKRKVKTEATAAAQAQNTTAAANKEAVKTETVSSDEKSKSSKTVSIATPANPVGPDKKIADRPKNN